MQLVCYIDDDPNLTSYFRYMTAHNDEPFIPGLGSVVDDRLFNGDAFTFPLARGQRAFDEFDPDTFGYFWRGDSLQVKWMSLDEAHYNFWSTVEFDTGSQGPFSSYVRIESNVEGGLGIWGGINASYHSLTIPE